MIPVVTAHEMRRLEELAYAAGENAERFMERAGSGVAGAIERTLLSPTARIISLLIGKGNKGGDAFVAGVQLLQKGYEVHAYMMLGPLTECSELCQKMAKRFQQAGGAIHTARTDFPTPGFLVDGLVGTGFKGPVEGNLKEAILAANASGMPILAVDLPSGLDASTGEADLAIQAVQTVTMGLPKIGFFIGKGWDLIGQLTIVNFGLPQKILAQVTPEAYLFNAEEAGKMLPKIQRSRHKYQRGYLVALAGSPGMPGAALLTCYAALRAGAGIVRLFHPGHMEMELSVPELIREEWNAERFFEECKRAKAVVVGPGLGRTEEIFKLLREVLPRISLPVVLDADALFYLSKERNAKFPQMAILTPHREEMQRLLGEAPTMKNCQEFVEKKHATVILKGAPTMIFHPGEKPLIVARGDPGMATAGAGDVLTGVVGALLAQGLQVYQAAALGVFLHALSGEMAATQKTQYAVIASDLIEMLPAVFKGVMRKDK